MDYSSFSDDCLRAAIRNYLDKMKGDKASLIGEVVKRWLKLALRDIEEQKEKDEKAVLEVITKPTLFPVSLEDESDKTGVMFIGYARNSAEANKLYRFAYEHAWMIENWGKKEAKRRIRRMWVNLLRMEELEKSIKERRRSGPSRS